MRIVYLDSDFRCHISDDGTMSAFETDFFDGKCEEFIAGHRIVPEGRSWKREDGKVFPGPMISLLKPLDQLDAAQRQYEREQLADMRMALNALGVNVDG